MTTLLLSASATEDNQKLWRAAVRSGWKVERIRGLNIPDDLDRDAGIALYVEALYAPDIADQLQLTLVEPATDWLVNLPETYRLRSIQLTTLGKARLCGQPTFIKPPNDKSFKAMIYASGHDLPDDFDDEMDVLLAEPVEFEYEYRCFVLDRTVQTLSPYLRKGRLSKLDNYQAPADEMQDALQFVEQLLADPDVFLPDAVVVDVGSIKDRGWAVVEANSVWGSGIYGCNPDKVLEVMQRAFKPSNLKSHD